MKNVKVHVQNFVDKAFYCTGLNKRHNCQLFSDVGMD